MKNKKILLLIISVALLVGAFYAYREYNRPPVDTASATPDAELTGAELVAAFEQDEPGSTARFAGKLIRVTEVLSDYSADETGLYTLVLGAGQSSTVVRCSMDSAFSVTATPVTKGEKITLQGVCSGYNKDELLGSDVILVRCSLIKK
jgi:tRNA_anti-like